MENNKFFIEQIAPSFLYGQTISENFVVFKVPLERTSEVVKIISKIEKM